MANYAPCFEEIEDLIDYFTFLLKDSTDAGVVITIKDKLIYFESLLDVLKIKNLENQKIAIFYKRVAPVYSYFMDYNQAILLNKLSLDIIKFVGSSHIDCSDLYNNLGSIYDKINEKEKSLNYYKKSLKIKENFLGNNHSDTAITYDNIAVLYVSMGRYSEAITNSKKAIKIFENSLYAKPIDIAKSYDILSWIYQQIGKWKEGLLYTLKARKIFQNLGEHSPDTIICNNNLARIYSKIGKKSEALFLYKKYLEISEKYLGIDDMTTAMIYHDLAIFYYEKKKCQDAKDYVIKAFMVKEKFLPPEHSELLDLQDGMSRIEECIKNSQKIGGNNPCPCNSGKKYKKCCGKSK